MTIEIMKKLSVNYLALQRVFVATNLVAQDSPDSSVARKTGFSGFPYAYYTPETELAVGVGGILTFYTGKERVLRPLKATLSGYYATTGQYKFTLAPQFYFSRNRYFASAALDYGNYVDRFYGIGGDTPDIDSSQYVSQAFGAELDFELPPPFQHLSLRAGIIYDFFDNTIVDKKIIPICTAAKCAAARAA